MKDFKIRCSQIGQIMGNMGLTQNQEITLLELSKKDKLTERQKQTLIDLTHKKNNPEIPQTIKSYVDRWLKEQVYGRREFIETKAMRKGILCEDRAIEYAGGLFGWKAIKNAKEFNDEYMTGTPDVILPDAIVDLKCPWSCFTFPLYEKEPDKGYWWQLQGYMNLTGKENAFLIYTLMDLPDDMLDQELHYAKYRFDVLELSDNQRDQVIGELTYENLPDELRIKVFEIERDQEAIDSVKKRVEEIREYIKSL